MDNTNFFASIMAGGSGTRFWPLSTSERPKQFLRLFGEASLFADTVGRLSGLVRNENISAMTLPCYETLIRDQVNWFADENLLFEPSLRNTGPAIAAACFRIYRRNPEAVIAFLPSDHFVTPVDAFQGNLKAAFEKASKGGIATIGIEPGFPSTDYGYIECDRKQEDENGFLQVTSFHEKPPIELAKEYFESGKHYFNAGIFVARADFLLSEVKRNVPEIYELAEDFSLSLNPETYSKMPNISLDYAVMENCNQISVLPASFKWSDLGTYKGLYNLHETHLDDLDEEGNHYFGNVFGREKFHGVKNSMVVNYRDDISVVLNQVEGLTVLISDDKVLISSTDAENKAIKEFSKIDREKS